MKKYIPWIWLVLTLILLNGTIENGYKAFKNVSDNEQVEATQDYQINSGIGFLLTIIVGFLAYRSFHKNRSKKKSIQITPLRLNQSNKITSSTSSNTIQNTDKINNYLHLDQNQPSTIHNTENKFDGANRHLPYLQEQWERTLNTMKIDFTEDERKEILQILSYIQNVGDVYPAQERIFTNYFLGKDWRWPEFDYWNEYFTTHNLWPHNKNWDTLYSKRTKPEKKAKAKFMLLFTTLEERAKSMERLDSGQKLGIEKFKIFPLFDGELELMEYGRAHSFSGYPPYIPGQMTMIRDIIPEFGDKD